MVLRKRREMKRMVKGTFKMFSMSVTEEIVKQDKHKNDEKFR